MTRQVKGSMTLADIGELALIDKIRLRFARKSRAVVKGIGDDAAVLRGAARPLLATADMMVEGVHFDLRFITPRQLGFKLVSANVSDIYAMGGVPQFALLSIAVPGKTSGAFMDDFFDGVDEALRAYRVALIGGDISSSAGPAALSATVLGQADRPVFRSGARPGDKIYVTGTLGDSACGLRILKALGRTVDFRRPLDFAGRGRNRRLTWAALEPLLRRHLLPEARKPLKGATAMIDVSDGLFIDLARLTDESGVGARVYLYRLPISDEMKRAAMFLGLDALELAVSGGEDYELLFTSRGRVPIYRSRNSLLRVTCIGEITKTGKVAVDEEGIERPFRPEGYRHFNLARRQNRWGGVKNR